MIKSFQLTGLVPSSPGACEPGPVRRQNGAILSRRRTGSALRRPTCSAATPFRPALGISQWPRVRFQRHEMPARQDVSASGTATADSAPSAEKPTEWLQSLPFLRKAPSKLLHRLNIGVNCLIIMAVIFMAFSNFFTANESLWNKWVTSTQRLLSNAPSAAWKAYTQAAVDQPWSTCMAISGVTYFLADWTAQTFEGRPLLGINTMRLIRSVLTGTFILGPFAHAYYHFQDQLFSAIIPASWTTLMVAPFKIAIDQTFYAAAYNVIFYMGLGLFAFRNPFETWSEIRRVFWRLMKAGWKVWPLVHCFTYTVIPITHRLLWVDTIEVAWVTFLSIVANEKKKATEGIILTETKKDTVKVIEEKLDTRSEAMIVEAQVKELIEKDGVQELVTAIDSDKSDEKATEAVVAYSENRERKGKSTGGDPALGLLDAIQAEDLVQSEVAEVLRQTGIETKSIEEMSPSSEDSTSKDDAPADIQAQAAEDLKAISQSLQATFREMAQNAARAEVAKLAKDMEASVEKDETIEKLKEELAAARQKLKQAEVQAAADSEEPSDRQWMGP